MVSSWGWLLGLPRLPGGVEALVGPREAAPARRRRAMPPLGRLLPKALLALLGCLVAYMPLARLSINAALAARGTQSDRRLDAGQLSENILSSPAAVALALARQLGSAAATQGSTPDRAAQISE